MENKYKFDIEYPTQIEKQNSINFILDATKKEEEPLITRLKNLFLGPGINVIFYQSKLLVLMSLAIYLFAISLGYSIVVSQKTKNAGESTVTTTSIIEMKASTVTIKNTLTGTGNVEYKEKDENIENNAQEQENTEEVNNSNTENVEKVYKIVLSIEDKNLEKAKIGQNVEISIKKDEETLNYLGTVTKINKDSNNKSTLNIEITNPDERLEEGMQANCTVIIEKAENVVGLPVEAIQKDEEGKEYVDVVKDDRSADKVYIKTGISDDYYVEITYGLNVGDSVQIVKSTTTVVNKDNNKNTVSEK